MNYILGGGSFSSRITKVVRTDNGLAYSTSSSFSGGLLYPGTFAAFCQTKNSTVVFASQLMLDLIEGMRAGDVSQADLDFAKTARVEAFPATFGSLSQTLMGLAQLEYNNRPRDYYDTLRAKYEKVTVADLKRVAQKWLQARQDGDHGGRHDRRVQGRRRQVPAQPGDDRRDGREVRRPDDGRPREEVRRRNGARGDVEVVRRGGQWSVVSGQFSVDHA